MPAIRTGRRVTHVNIAPVSRILIIPVITAVRNAIRRPLEKSFQSSVRNFDFMAWFIRLNFHNPKINLNSQENQYVGFAIRSPISLNEKGTLNQICIEFEKR